MFNELEGKYIIANLGILRRRATTETPTIRGYTGAGVNSCRPTRQTFCSIENYNPTLLLRHRKKLAEDKS